MKIGLFGYGKMGRLVAELAKIKGHEIVAIVTSKSCQEWEQADVMIDFSLGDAVLEHVDACIQAKKSLIIGATGWEEHLPAVQAAIKNSSIGCLYSPNFSIGIYLFRQIVAYAAKLLQNVPGYSVSGFEVHHQQKKDAPSGTAKVLQAEILQSLPHLGEIPFSSLRTGHFPGTHTFLLDSLDDTITLSHEARSRNGFAKGALLAAEWIINKKGFFTFEDIFR